MRRLILILLLVLVLISPSSAAEQCSNDIEVYNSGETFNGASFTLSPSDGYYYPRGGEYEVSIPSQATDISITDDEGDDLLQETKESRYLNTRLFFSNDEKVESSEDYSFNIEYRMPRGTTVYEDKIYFSQIIPLDFCEQNSVAFSFPEEWNVVEASENASVSEGEISSPYKEITEVRFESPEKLNQKVNYNTETFNVTVPSTYRDFTRSQVEEIEKMTSDIEEETSIQTPKKFDLVYLPLNSSDISKESAGQYYGGRIEVKSTQLSRKRVDSFETLFHEVIHGYNDKLSEGSPDWWWEEGTAEYLSHKIMRENGYNTSIFQSSPEAVQNTFEDCGVERNFISDWTPINEGSFDIEPVYICPLDASKDYISDRRSLGYSYSELIVAEMFSDREEKVSDVYGLMQEKNVSFSNSREKMNNQINFFTSQVFGQDMTEFYLEKGIETDNWETKYQTIKEVEEEINDLNGRYRYELFRDLEKDLQEIRVEFYRGNLTKNGELADLEQRIEERNETVVNTLQRYNAARERVSDLEEKREPQLFTEQSQDLNKSLELIQSMGFERASLRISEINNSVSERKQNISEYVSSLDSFESNVESTSFVFKPFLLDTEDKLEESRQEFSAGNLETAEEKLQSSRSTYQLSRPIGAVSYVIILCIGSLVARRFL